MTELYNLYEKVQYNVRYLLSVQLMLLTVFLFFSEKCFSRLIYATAYLSSDHFLSCLKGSVKV